MTNPLVSPPERRLMQLVTFVALAIFLPLSILGAQRITALLTRAAGVPANIVVNVNTQMDPVRLDFYHAFGQYGKDAEKTLAPVLSQIRGLRPKLIRIDHVYDYYHVVGRNNDSLTYNWSELDRVVDLITSSGATPLLSLSFVPQKIALNGYSGNPPARWSDWEDVVRQTIEHYSGKSGKNINAMYYEIGNEPDSPDSGGWTLEGNKNYLTLYTYASRGATKSQNINSFFLGGPVTSELKNNWIDALVTSGNRIDYLSWHTFNTDPAKFGQELQNIKSLLSKYPPISQIPLLITAYDFSAGSSVATGNPYAAAYTAAAIRNLLDNQPKYLVSYQLKNSAGQRVSHAMDLMTSQNAILELSPRYKLYSFLDEMSGNRLPLIGEGTWVTGFATKEGNYIRVFLVNFHPDGLHTEQVPVTLTGVTPGTYQVRQKFLSGKDFAASVVASDAVMTTHVYLSPSGVVLLEISKK